MKLTKLAQSTFQIEVTGCRVLIDPGKYNFESGYQICNALSPVDILIITHHHADHFDSDAVRKIVAASPPNLQILTTAEGAAALESDGIGATVFEWGSECHCGELSFYSIRTDHVVRGEHIDAFGVVIESESGYSIYHTGDTRYIDPSTLYQKVFADILLVPIANRGVVMGIDDAVYFTRELKPQTVIPMHYDSPKDRGRVNPEAFIKHFQDDSSITAHLLSFGKSFNFECEGNKTNSMNG